MQISINDPIQATWIFSIILAIGVFATLKRRKFDTLFPPSLTQELKGLAILMIVLSHIGYFLATDTRFLWPLSIMAGVGVNLFLFLSGYGLAVSQTKSPLNPWQFYKKRLSKLYLPYWLAFFVILALDTFLLGVKYDPGFLIKGFFGIFTHADLFHDLNSPLWYFTFIIGNYLLFPLVCFGRRTWLGAFVIALAGWLLLRANPALLSPVMHLYEVHIFAFPLGILAASIIPKLKVPVISGIWKNMLYYFSLIVLAGIFVYANINSGVGESAGKEQLMSLVAVLSLCGFFMLKKIESRLLYLLGIYSYEIYLWHWPILFRYDFLYNWLPAWLATVLYLAVFIGIGWVSAWLIRLMAEKKAVRVDNSK